MNTRTPILDQVVPVPCLEQRWNSASNLTCRAVLINVGLWTVVVLNGIVLRANPLWTLVVLILADTIACLLHKCGHAIAAILLGHRLISFRAGAISLVRRRHGVQFTFEWKKFLGGGAVGAVSPPGGVRRWRLFILYACGPLTSLVTLGFLIMQWRAWLQLAPAWFLPLVFVSTTSLLTNLIPQETGGTLSDGARLLLLLHRDHALAVCAVVDLLGQVNRGHRPANWDPARVALAATCSRYNSDRFIGNLLAYRWACACADRDRAAGYLESVLSVCTAVNPAVCRPLFRMAAALQVTRRNFGAARVWLERANEPAPIRNAGLVPSVLLSLSDRTR
jgi:hypothetical protein